MILTPEARALLEPAVKVPAGDEDDFLRRTLRAALREPLDNSIIDAHRLVRILEEVKRLNKETK